MADANKNLGNLGYPVKCPFCGSENPVGSVFCQECGKKFNMTPSAQPAASSQSYQPPPPPSANYQQPRLGRSNRRRNIVIAAVAVVLIVSLVFAGVLFMSPNNKGGNSQVTPTPTATAAPTRTPTIEPITTPTPTLKPTSTPQAQNNTITAINLQFNYS